MWCLRELLPWTNIYKFIMLYNSLSLGFVNLLPLQGIVALFLPAEI
jgi:hypothetical protein